jgi:hypothetical protein
MCHWSLMCHSRLPTTDFQCCQEGEGGRGVKKCFLGLRQTALLSADGKKVTLATAKKGDDANQIPAGALSSWADGVGLL